MPTYTLGAYGDFCLSRGMTSYHSAALTMNTRLPPMLPAPPMNASAQNLP
eukprot:COSAG01_NODE_61219_length_290_cov_1.565445_1_plen_49_part_01